MNVDKNLLLRNLKYELKRIGVDALVLAPIFDSRNEATGEYQELGKIKGIFHQTQIRQSKTVKNIITHKTKQQPMLLCLYDDCVNIKIKSKDVLTINQKKYKIIGISNVNEIDVACEVTLELIDDGTSRV